MSQKVKITEGDGIVRQTNPTPKFDNQPAVPMFDDVGRRITMPFQVRDLVSTASASLTNGTAITLLAAGSGGVFNDCVHVSFANNSTAAANVVLLSDGTIIKTIQVPANNTLSIDFTYPLTQPVANTIWSVDMEDVTGTTVNVDAVFVKNV